MSERQKHELGVHVGLLHTYAGAGELGCKGVLSLGGALGSLDRITTSKTPMRAPPRCAM